MKASSENNSLHDLSSLKMTRRRLFGSAASIAAAAAASALLPPNVRRALAQAPPRRGSIKDIKHVVLLMQENRSFDHYFGTMAGVRGFDDPDALKLPNGKSIFYQPDPENPAGYLLPFHLDTRTTSAQKIPSTSHSWPVQHASWNGGKMDNWLPAHRAAEGAKAPYVMGYHTRADIPFQFALAEAFTLCDAYHCSVMGPTWPNRMYWMTGCIDADGENGGPMINNKPIKEGFTWKTYAERLEGAGVSWKVYQQQDNYGCNMLEYFKTFKEAAPDSNLATRGMVREPEGKFEYDAINDNLPTVSWIITTSTQSEHPDFMPAAGAAFVASKIDAIAANPEVWAKTAFILNYDENDGIFDHVAPPVPPPGTPKEFVNGQPIGGGFRVPCIVVSPWTAGGWVCSQPFDHTSVLQFLEKFTGVKEPNITEWRRQTFGDLTSAFRFDEATANPPRLPDTVNALSRARYESAYLPKPVLPARNRNRRSRKKGSASAPRQPAAERLRRGSPRRLVLPLPRTRHSIDEKLPSTSMRIITLFLLVLGATVRASELLIGSATVDITPTQPVALAGQFSTRISKKPETPIVVSAVAIESREAGQRRDLAIMIACDLVAIRNGIQEQLREKLAPLLPDVDVRKVFLSATHTHTAPVTTELKGSPNLYNIPAEGVMQPDAYVEFLIERLAQAAVKAWESRQPGGVSWTLGHAVVGQNRREVYADGHAQMYGKTGQSNFRSIEGGEDHAAETIFFWDAEKRLRAVAINLACPSQEVEGRSDINADYWHEVREQLKAKLSLPDLTVLGWCSAAGGQSPHLMYRQAAEERMLKARGLTRLQEIGRRITAAVMDTMDIARADIRTDAPFSHSTAELNLPPRKISPASMRTRRSSWRNSASSKIRTIECSPRSTAKKR